MSSWVWERLARVTQLTAVARITKLTAVSWHRSRPRVRTFRVSRMEKNSVPCNQPLF